MKSQTVKDIFRTTPGHDTVVDAVRAFAVLATIIFHVFAGILRSWDLSIAKTFLTNIEIWMLPLLHAEKGVDAFFFLSGLILGVPLFKNLNSFGWSQAKNFYLRRFLRIYPLFFIALLFYHLIQKGTFNTEFIANIFFINNFSMNWAPIIPVGWSLTIEMQLYLLVPFYIWMIRKTKSPHLIMGITVIISFFISAQTLLAHPEIMNRHITDNIVAQDRDRFSAFYGKIIYESFANRFAPFVMGIWMAYLKAHYPDRLSRIFKNKNWETTLTATGFALVAVVLFMPVYSLNDWYVQNLSREFHFFFQIFSRQVFILGLALLVLSAWYGNGPGASLRSISQLNVWAPFSKLAYPIYLFHYPCIIIAALMIFQTGDLKVLQKITLIQATLIFLLSCILSIIVSIPLHIYIERKFINLQKK